MNKRKRVRTIATDVFGLSSIDNPINSKKKGDNNERELCKWLLNFVGVPFIRTPSSGGRRLLNASNFCGDVVCEDEDFEFPFVVETKHYAQFTFSRNLRKNSGIYKVYFQAKSDAERAGKDIWIALRNNGMKKRTWVMYFTQRLEGIEVLSEGNPEEGVTLFGYSSEDVLRINFDNLKFIHTFT